MSASSYPGRVVTRFAPSPTGFLHLGGARTALFNWLYARRYGGEFKLRIEDTDRARSTDAAIMAILDGLRWLELDWHGDEIYQFARSARHAEVAYEMLASGHAYRCWLTPDELAGMRARAAAEKRPFRVESPWRDRDPSEAREAAPFVVRLKAPRDGDTTIDDRVQGSVTVHNAEIDDFVMLRGDGTPTYMLSVVVDDHDMGVTHVIRGDDHLNNAFRQLGIIRAMRWPEPVYAHVPLIHGADGAKLSKRHGALGIEAYRDEMGILPEALANYLVRLGWGHGDDEIFSMAQATEWFDLDGIGKSPSRFDSKKLEHINAHYIREADDKRLASLAAAETADWIGRDLTAAERKLLQRSMPSIKLRAKSITEIAEGVRFLFRTCPLKLDEGASRLLDEDSRILLSELDTSLRGVAEWTEAALDAAVRGLADEHDIKLGMVAQPLRAALTGQATSPGIFDVLLLLGREESLARIADQVA